MSNNNLPLEEKSIEALFFGSNKATYIVPIYQRNYAWGKDEITALVQDVYDSYKKSESSIYYIGTLVSFNRGDSIFEVIDGQQRLTTIRIVLGVLGLPPTSQLTYSARKKSDRTLKSIPEFKDEEKDYSIVEGYRYAKTAVKEIVPIADEEKFKNYFLQKVHIIHYQVPKDIDLNHYFEIMNSRGEQLEKHEIIKARMLSTLQPRDRYLFSQIWESCSKMSVYIQQALSGGEKGGLSKAVFGGDSTEFILKDFDGLSKKEVEDNGNKKSIEEFIKGVSGFSEIKTEKERPDTFQPIIDFSNFLLIVLKITRMEEGFNTNEFNLDDKELINEFNEVTFNEVFVKKFGYNLLKAKYYLDNFIVHHANEEDTIDNNPWSLQKCYYDNKNKKNYPKNLFEDDDLQIKALQLLSMFEVSFTARQRKNYLFYCLFNLLKNDTKPYKNNLKNYLAFVEGLATKYFYDIYLDNSQLNAINTPVPGSFDNKIIVHNEPNIQINRPQKSEFIRKFKEIYGDGRASKSNGIPLFIFNYLDYKIWNKYANDLRGEKSKEGSPERKKFFKDLGCSDFKLDNFKLFYFSRTRRSLEHYYAQATATGQGGRLNENEINCFGNYAMIGSEVNSSGSNNSPLTKLDHYLDQLSGKVKLISVASLKFMIMMKICKDNHYLNGKAREDAWLFEDIKNHQEKMLNILY